MGVSEGLPALVDALPRGAGQDVPIPAPYVGSPRIPARPVGGTEERRGESATGAAPASAPVPSQSAPVPSGETGRARPFEIARAPVAPWRRRCRPGPPPGAATPRPGAGSPRRRPQRQRRRPRRRSGTEGDSRRRRGSRQEGGRSRGAQKAADDKKKAEQDAVAQKKAEDDKRAADKLAKERGLREAEVARRNAEVARQKAEEDKARDKALAEAAARLKAAQDAYQAEIQKTKGGQK